MFSPHEAAGNFLFNSLDLDNDGDIEAEEAFPVNEGNHMSSFVRDKDGDGKLSPEEAASDADLIGSHDQDQTGSLDLMEFMKAFSTHFPKGDTQTILKTLGTVDPAEAELAKSISHAIWNTEMAQAKRNMILEMIVAGAQQQNPDINFIKLKIGKAVASTYIEKFCANAELAEQKFLSSRFNLDELKSIQEMYVDGTTINKALKKKENLMFERIAAMQNMNPMQAMASQGTVLKFYMNVMTMYSPEYGKQFENMNMANNITRIVHKVWDDMFGSITVDELENVCQLSSASWPAQYKGQIIHPDASEVAAFDFDVEEIGRTKAFIAIFLRAGIGANLRAVHGGNDDRNPSQILKDMKSISSGQYDVLMAAFKGVLLTQPQGPEIYHLLETLFKKYINFLRKPTVALSEAFYSKHFSSDELIELAKWQQTNKKYFESARDRLFLMSDVTMDLIANDLIPAAAKMGLTPESVMSKMEM